MPLSSGPVGPFPTGADPEEYDRLRRRVLWTMPSGLYIVGSRAGERRNGMTCNWVTQLGFDLDPDVTATHLARLVDRSAELGRTCWIDMESTHYAAATVD